MAEKEYIERGALIAEYDRVHVGAPGGARKLMVEAPAADVVEVVRCKDCILYEPKYLAGLQKNDNYGICTRYKFLTEEYSFRFETDFCSYGERKSEK